MKEIDIYTPLPNPSELNLNAAKEIALFIRRDLRPYILSRLGRLYTQPNDSIDNIIDVMELEMRIQEVDIYADEIDAIIQEREPPVNAQEKRIELLDVRLDGNAFASCYAPLFFGPAGKYFVHGPVLLLFITSLAERILKPSERITRILSVSWKKPVVNNTRLAVYDPTAKHLVNSDDSLKGKPSVAGAFQTSDGRKLIFLGIEIPEDPVTEEAGRNTLSLKTLPQEFTYDRDNRLLRLELRSDLDSKTLNILDSSVPLTVFTLFGIGAIGAIHLFLTMGGKKFLTGSVRDFPLPDSPGKTLKAGVTFEITALMDRARGSKETGVRIVPVRYRFLPWQTRFSRGMGAETDLPYFRWLG